MITTEKNSIRAVLYDDQFEQFETFKRYIERCLKYKSEHVELTWVKTRTELEAELKKRPHAVFCDGYHNGDALEGLHAIHALKPEHRDTLFCLISREAVSVLALGSYTPNPDLIIYKGSLGRPEYDDYIGKKLRRLIRRTPFPKFEAPFNLKVDGPKDITGKRSMTIEELHSIVEQVIDVEGVGAIGDEFDSAHLEPIKGGFSGAGVYNLQIKRRGGLPNIPAILKISARDDSVREFRNFLKYVKWRLPYLWRVDVLGTGITARFGAICYSPAMGGLERPRPVNVAIREGEFRVVDKVIESILDPNNQTWYKERRDTEVDIREYFTDNRFYRTDKSRHTLEMRFYKYLQDSLDEESAATFITSDSQIIINGQIYPKIDHLIFTSSWGFVRECLCHGDMNGGNLLFSNIDSPIVFIDFQDTGFSHVFRDFVSFESSVRLEYPNDRKSNENEYALFQRCLRDERALAQARWSILPQSAGLGHYISRIRYAASENFKGEPLALYLVANIVHMLWLFDKSESWDVHKRIRMAATILESTRMLSDLKIEGGK